MCRNEIQFSGVHAIFLWFISVWLWSIYKPINNSYAHKSFTLLWHDLIKVNVCQFVLSYIDRILWLAKSQPVLGRNFRANLLSGNRYVPWFDPICGRTFADSHQFSAFFGRRRIIRHIFKHYISNIIFESTNSYVQLKNAIVLWECNEKLGRISRTRRCWRNLTKKVIQISSLKRQKTDS